MNIRSKRVFLYITACIFLADAFFVAINYYNDSKNLSKDLEFQSRQFQSSFEVALSMTTANMSQLATYVAHDVGVQTIFEKATHAYFQEKDQPDKPLTKKYRDELYQEVANSWQEMKSKFYVRQLHFHIPPDTSLLRVHRPQKWGDDLSPLRHLIVDVMNDHHPRHGFELGRIYAGVRGAVPVYAPSTQEGKQGKFLGVLEAGTSFSEIMGILKQQVGADLTVLLNGDRVSDVKWKNGLGGHHAEVCGCFVEASSNDVFQDILAQIDLIQYRENKPFALRSEIITLGASRYLLTHFGITDYIGRRDNHTAPVGRVMMWTDIEHKYDEIYSNTRTNVIYALIGFIIIELLIFYGIRSALGPLTSIINKQDGEIRLLLEKALEANKAKNEFLTNMSHELRTPMMGVRGGLDLLKENHSLDANAKERLNYLESSANALMALVDDILDLSKLESKKLSLDEAPYQISSLCHEVHDIFADTATAKGLHLICHVQEDKDKELWHNIDSLRVRQIISNLINNAIKFTDNGSITLSLDIHEGEELDKISITVADTGIGMTDEELEKVFERFTQADGSTTRKYGGTGLGLTISKELAHLLGGDLLAQSQPGEGTTFTLSITAKKCESPHIQTSQTEKLRPLHILLAEDNQINQQVVSVMLKGQGHTVDTANNGKEAVEAATNKKYDIILMDIQMPEMDGRTATKHIRNHSGPNQQSGIFAFTADAIQEHIDEFMQDGFNNYILKPVKLSAMEEKIAAYLDKNSG